MKIPEMSKKFFLKAMLPELLGDYVTREVSSTVVSNNSDNECCWCYCRMSQSENILIGCDNSIWKIEWSHLTYVFIKKNPKGKWFCPDCEKIMYQQRKIK